MHFHQQRAAQHHVENHGGDGGKYIKSIVFGGLDGIITTFAVVAGVAGAGLDMKIVLVLGFTNLIADGISMGFGDYLSEKAELEYTHAERQREEWEMENFPDGERQEMVELYTKRGLSKEDAENVINIMSKEGYEQFFVDLMMVEELGLLPPDDGDNPAMNGLITFTSFVVFGILPLIVYIPYVAVGSSDDTAAFAVACVVTAMTMFLLGYVKGRISNTHAISSAIAMLGNGTLAASMGYVVGFATEAIVDAKTCG